MDLQAHDAALGRSLAVITAPGIRLREHFIARCGEMLAHHLACTALTLPPAVVSPTPTPAIVVQQQSAIMQADNELLYRDLLFPPAATLIADDADDADAEAAAAKDRARLAGVGALAFGILPSIYASSIGIGGAAQEGKINGRKKK